MVSEGIVKCFIQLMSAFGEALENHLVMLTTLVLFGDLSGRFKAMASRIISQLGSLQSASGGGSKVQVIVQEQEDNDGEDGMLWNEYGH